MKAFSSLTSIGSIRIALAAAFLVTTACGSGDDTAPTGSDSGPDGTMGTPDTGTGTPDTGTGTPDTGTGTPDTGTGTPDTGTGTPDTGTGNDGGVAEAAAPEDASSFAAAVWPIIQGHCIGCHGVGTGPDGGTQGGFNNGHLDMGDASAAYTSLLGDGGGALAQGVVAVPAEGGVTCADLAADAGLKRVVPNDATHSLICNKVSSKEDGGPAVFCGNPMPLGTTTPLDPALVQIIKDWINSGAKP